jgi:hypothetical protein
MVVMSETTTAARPGRYQRSFAGMVGALIVTVLVILAFVIFRALVRDTPATQVEPVDYLDAVEGAQLEGLDVAYPPTLPEGWVATSVDLAPSDPPRWSLGVLTEDGDFVGLRQEDASARTMAQTHVDEDAEQGSDVTLDSDLADTWGTWSDDGGDHAVVAEVAGLGTVLVYGSAPEPEIEAYAASLTTAPR